jgi:hypothetical protein
MVRRCLASVMILTAVHISAQTRAPAVESEVKAAYLLQFGRYVEGFSSEDQGRPFVICVLGEDPFGAALDGVSAGKVISGRPAAVRRIVGVTESRDCRVLFLSGSEDDRLPAILRALEGRRVLTVGEGTQFTRRGGMIGFTLMDNKVRFAVNLAAVDAAKLALSAQLLRLAVNVER